MRSLRNKRPQGRQDGPLQANGQKRKHDEEEPKYLKSKKFRLTEKNLRRQQREEKIMAKTRKLPTNSDGTSRPTTTTTTTDRLFGPRLMENGVVFEQARTVAPTDLDKVKAALAKELEIPAKADMDFQNVLEAKEEMVYGELSLESAIIKTMLMESPRFKYHQCRNDQWTEVENEITAGISDAKPDVVETYIWSAYPARTREDFEELVPTQYGYSMPTFAMESKGEGDAAQAVKQAAYDGAIMTHASIAAEKQMEKTDLYSKTKAITVTLNPNEVCVYVNHAVKDQSSGKVAYHHHLVERVFYMESELNWKHACSVVRNAQTFAQSLADSRIEDIKQYFVAKDAELKKLKTERDRLQAEAKAEQERLQAEVKAEQDKRQAEAKAERQKLLAEKKAERQKQQAETKAERQKRQAEARAEAGTSGSRRNGLSGPKTKKAADKATVPAIKQVDQAAPKEASIDTRVTFEQAKVHGIHGSEALILEFDQDIIDMEEVLYVTITDKSWLWKVKLLVVFGSKRDVVFG